MYVPAVIMHNFFLQVPRALAEKGFGEWGSWVWALKARKKNRGWMPKAGCGSWGGAASPLPTS